MPQPRRFAFVSLTATGPDPRVDRLFRLAVRLPDGRGRATSHEWLAHPSIGRDAAAREAVSARIHRIYGVSGSALAEHPPANVQIEALAQQLEGRTAITLERSELLRWWSATSPGLPPPPVVGVADLARLVLPGRRSAERERLLQLAFQNTQIPRGEPTPEQTEAILAATARAFLSRSPEELTLAVCAFLHIRERLLREDPAAAAVLEASLDLLDRPSAWASKGDGLFALTADLVDGELSRRADGPERAVEAFDRAQPRLATELETRFVGPPLADVAPDATALSDRDLSILDALFEEWLPRDIASAVGESDPTKFYRPSQHGLARRIGEALSKQQILLVDAPTGTGKTMAYLVPALLWARAASARVGVSTYTIALQEQVFDRELPRALSLLRRAGAWRDAESEPRACVLKGRERYVCLRALRSAAPSPDDSALEWLTWTVLALFALDDPEGDLDRLARTLPYPTDSGREGMLADRLREVRCRPRCCTRASDRKHCGAWVARRRAERSHLVVTNHAFVLRDPLFLRVLIADECDHLHAQARGAASIELSMRGLRELVEHVTGSVDPAAQRARAAGRSLLPRLARGLQQRGLFEGHALGASCAAAVRSGEAALAAVAKVDRVAGEYVEFLRERERESGFDSHKAFQQFALEHPASVDLRSARSDLFQSLSELAGICEEVAAGLAGTSVEDATQLAARFHQSATDLADAAVEVGDWLPIADGELRFDPTCFYDLEVETGRGRAPNITARRSILLPNRWLAERYFPSMQSCVLLSASTWLQKGFDLTRGYLGLDLVAEGSEARAARTVEQLHSPPTFDYSRVLLAIPDDVPQTSFADPQGRAAFDRYLQSLLRFLVERTRGRTLVLLTNLEQCKALGRALEPFFREKCIPFFWQGMPGRSREELPRLFRSSEGGCLMGVDTFWYGVDFPGDLLEFLVIAKLPFGALDRYTNAQQAALGRSAHLQKIYLPEAFAMFRQGFGRLMRRETDRGAVLVLDTRILSRWRRFLEELPGRGADVPAERRLRELVAPTQECVRAALAHCGMLEECRRLGLPLEFTP